MIAFLDLVQMLLHQVRFAFEAIDNIRQNLLYCFYNG